MTSPPRAEVLSSGDSLLKALEDFAFVFAVTFRDTGKSRLLLDG
jgi:hypothetical protein